MDLFKLYMNNNMTSLLRQAKCQEHNSGRSEIQEHRKKTERKHRIVDWKYT